MRLRHKVCAYCGAKNPETRDHIPPKGCFPEPLPSDLITVPCCYACREGWSNDDEYFRTILLMSQNLSKDARAMKQFKKVIRALSRSKRRGLAHIMGKSLKIATVRTRAGIIIGKQPVVQFDRPRIERVLSRIIRGLYYYEYSHPLPTDYDVYTIIDQFGEKSAEVHSDGPFPRAKWVADKMFLYTHLKTKEDPYVSVWLCAFYEKVSFIGFTGINKVLNNNELDKLS